METFSTHDIVTIRDVMRPAVPLPSRTTVTAIVSVFTEDPSLLLLPLCSDDLFGGVISRKDLFSRHLARKYASELYGNKPVALLMDPNPFKVSPDVDINTALVRLLEFDPALEIDSFPVTEDTVCLGIVHVAELIVAISRGQARLLSTLEVLGERLRTEVDMARRIQRSLLPPAPFQFAGLVLDAVLINSSEISGDIYDYRIIDDQRMMVMVGDVSGHGVQSGMVATAAKAGLHLLLDSGVREPAELLAGMNRAVLTTASDSLMMTAVVAVIDRESNTLTYANAGHNYPYLYCATTGTLSTLDGASSFPLGFQDECGYGDTAIGYGSDDLLVLFSDGIIEAFDTKGEEFGCERLEDFLRIAGTGRPRQIVQGLVEAACAFTGRNVFEDDVTLLVVGSESGGMSWVS